MYYIATTRVPRKQYQTDPIVRNKVDGILAHLHNLALDVGFDPEKSVIFETLEDEVKIGISEDFDLYLRESPGEWRYY
ncbi:hypothetical protein [Megalodesulfovibrio paquesii]